MTWETTIPEYRAIRDEVAKMDDERLERELAFAEGFNRGKGDPHPNAAVWLKALREEGTERRADEAR